MGFIFNIWTTSLPSFKYFLIFLTVFFYKILMDMLRVFSSLNQLEFSSLLTFLSKSRLNFFGFISLLIYHTKSFLRNICLISSQYNHFNRMQIAELEFMFNFDASVKFRFCGLFWCLFW